MALRFGSFHNHLSFLFFFFILSGSSCSRSLALSSKLKFPLFTASHNVSMGVSDTSSMEQGVTQKVKDGGGDDGTVVFEGFESDFKPIEHPKDPSNEDRPVKCPVRGFTVSKGYSTERTRKMMEIPMVNEGRRKAISQPVSPSSHGRSYILNGDPRLRKNNI